MPHLTHAHTKRRKLTGRSVQKAPRIPFTRIDQRPEKINTRDTLGHWETDLMESSKDCPVALSVSTERVTRFVRMSKVEDKTAEEKSDSVHTSLAPLPDRLVRSVTIDNGSENTDVLSGDSLCTDVTPITVGRRVRLKTPLEESDDIYRKDPILIGIQMQTFKNLKR